MANCIAISVYFHDGRYHGEGDWPPCPARLFQALVAGAGPSGRLADARDPLTWLEKLPPPLIGAPLTRRGQRVMFYMPNNDLDAVGGDPRRIAEIRTAKKFFHPWYFDSTIPFLYIWQDVPNAEMNRARAICALADYLYQLGRGIDMAWAVGEVFDESHLDILLTDYRGQIFRPSGGSGEKTLLCPGRGSLDSIEKRYHSSRQRFDVQLKSKTAQFTFRQAPWPSFQTVVYDSPSSRHLYELRVPTAKAEFAPWPLVQAYKLVVCLRDAAVERLKKGLPDQVTEIERVLIGRKPDGTNAGPTAQRVKIVPLPSIGHRHADRAIRRVLVEIPAGGPLRDDDVHWAFSGLEPVNAEIDETYPIVLTPAIDDGMQRHYGISKHATARVWRTITPVALPEVAARRRIEPTRKIAEAKGSAERVQEQQGAVDAVIQALRHAEVRAVAETIRVQREPFDGNGERVEAFTSGTRFTKERLWHVEITFADRVSGPLVIGDGRFLGLGVLTPLTAIRDVYAFSVEAGLASNPEPIEVARALRRATMVRVQTLLGNSKPLPTFFTGHEPDGAPARSERHPHLTFLFDPGSARLVIIAPHLIDRREPNKEERQHLQNLEDGLTNFNELRAGSLGRLILRPISIDPDSDPLFAAARTWESVTPYVVTRHAKHVSAGEVFSINLLAECRRRGLPEPKITTRELLGIPGMGLVGSACLTFKVAVKGPLVLGRNRHLGGGLFARVTP